MIEREEHDISEAFPGYRKAVATVDGNNVRVKLHFSECWYETVNMRLDRIYDCLDRLRGAENKETVDV